MIARGTISRYVKKGTVFIETGTREGNTLALALELGAKAVYSVENNQPLYEKARVRFAGEPRAKLFFGHSPVALEQILKEISEPAVFWLDAHDPECPLVSELGVIEKHSIDNHTLLIDDVRLFRKAVWKIGLGRVIEGVLKINPNYSISMEDGYVPNDVLVAQILP
jgi:hypothetical protein